MKPFIAFAAALPTLAAALPMFVSVGAAIASKYSDNPLRTTPPSQKYNYKRFFDLRLDAPGL